MGKVQNKPTSSDVDFFRNFELTRKGQKNYLTPDRVNDAIDLHIHTSASDGVLTPGEAILEYRIKRGGSVMSFMDHDDFSASEAILQQFIGPKWKRELPENPKNLELVISFLSKIYGGAELTTTWRDREIHVKALGYTARESQSFSELEYAMNDTKIAKRKARLVDIDTLNDKLESDGYKTITEDDVDKIIMKKKNWLLDDKNEFYFGTPQIVEAAQVKNFEVSGRYGELSQETIFKEYIKKMERAPSESPDISRMVELGKDSGLLMSLAHPGRYNLSNREIVTLVKESGVGAVEVFYPTHTDKMVKSYAGIAVRNGLLLDVGSDHHTSEIKNGFGVTHGHNLITVYNKHVQPIMKALKGKDLSQPIKRAIGYE